MGDDDLDLLHVSRHRGMTIGVTGPIACEFVQPGLTQWPRAGDLVPDLVADVPRAHGPYRALADAGRTRGAASATNAIGPVTMVTVAVGPTLLTALSTSWSMRVSRCLCHVGMRWIHRPRQMSAAAAR
jgi:hypothetical protein